MTPAAKRVAVPHWVTATNAHNPVNRQTFITRPVVPSTRSRVKPGLPFRKGQRLRVRWRLAVAGVGDLSIIRILNILGMRVYCLVISLIIVIHIGMNKINELIVKRDALLMELAKLNGLVAGSFFARAMNGITRFCLSSVQGGRQRQTYVSAKHADAVRLGVRQHARALEIISELGKINLTLIKKGLGGIDA